MQSAFLLTVGFNYIGAQADINLWTPRVAQTDEFTTAQIWLKNSNGPYFASVESGWTVSSPHKLLYSTSLLHHNPHLVNNTNTKNAFSPLLIQVNPKLYGDGATRFFVYWTVSVYI